MPSSALSVDQYVQICQWLAGKVKKKKEKKTFAFLSVCPQQRLRICGDRSKSQHMTHGQRRRDTFEKACRDLINTYIQVVFQFAGTL